MERFGFLRRLALSPPTTAIAAACGLSRLVFRLAGAASAASDPDPLPQEMSERERRYHQSNQWGR
jgi:hypothetical protein